MHISLYFSDLSEEAQREVLEEVRSMLQASGDLPEQEEGEGWGRYEHRIYEVIDHYLNTHNKLEATVTLWKRKN